MPQYEDTELFANAQDFGIKIAEQERVQIEVKRLEFEDAWSLVRLLKPYLDRISKLETKDHREAGVEVIEMLLDNADKDVRTWLGNVMGIEPDEVRKVDLVQLRQWVGIMMEVNDLPGFIEFVQGLLKKHSGKLSSPSNGHTAGQTSKSGKRNSSASSGSTKPAKS